MKLSFREDKAFLQTNEGMALLAPVLYLPDEEKIRMKADKYAAGENYRIFFAFDGDLPAGLCILQPGHSDAEIAALSVPPSLQRQGIGRAMIAHVQAGIHLPLLAETDDDAVGFYEKCGFSITSLGEKYPGVIRYRCVLRQEDD